MQGPELPQRAGSATVATRAPSSHPDPVQGHNSQVPAAGPSSDWVCCSPIFPPAYQRRRRGQALGTRSWLPSELTLMLYRDLKQDHVGLPRWLAPGGIFYVLHNLKGVMRPCQGEAFV